MVQHLVLYLILCDSLAYWRICSPNTVEEIQAHNFKDLSWDSQNSRRTIENWMPTSVVGPPLAAAAASLGSRGGAMQVVLLVFVTSVEDALLCCGGRNGARKSLRSQKI